VDYSPFAQDGKLHGMNLMRLRRNHAGMRGGMVFDGMDDFVDVGRLGDFGHSLHSFTVTVWVKTISQHPSLSVILNFIDGRHRQSMSIETNRMVGKPGRTGLVFEPKLSFEPGNLLVYLRDNRGRVLAGHARAPIFNNRWHHIQWTVKDSEQNDMVLYVDGKEMSFVASIQQAPSRFGKLRHDLFIGSANNRDTAMGFFDGAIDDVRLFCKPKPPLFARKCCLICKRNEWACGNECRPKKDKRRCPTSAGCACDLIEVDNPIMSPLPEVIEETPLNVFEGRAQITTSRTTPSPQTGSIHKPQNGSTTIYSKNK